MQDLPAHRHLQAWSKALAALEDAAVLVRLGGGQRNRTWEAAGLLDLLAELDHAGTPAAHPVPVD